MILFLTAAIILSLRITEVTVTGNNRYTKEQLEQLIFTDKWDKNPAVCYYKSNWKPHKQIPFVEDYEIVFQSPASVEIIVYEKNIVGYVEYMSSYMYFDKDGIIVESANRKLPGIPWITGLDFGEIILYQPLPVKDQTIFDEILNLTQVLSIYDIQVDKIQYNSLKEAQLFMGDLRVVLGDSSQINGKVSELNDMLPHIKDRAGVLHLETYDENRPDMSFSFYPD